MHPAVILRVDGHSFRISRKLFWGWFLFCLFSQWVGAQTVAFPGALGFGANATGGRNGTVYHVTTLADSGAGSFRDAVSSGNRTIVFDVGGEIQLLSAVSCSSSLTIAGQTAPGGIVFNGGEISFANRNNIICRYIRIRPGSDTASSTDDALSFYRASNLIVDHSSIAFGPWNNIDGVGDSTHLVTAITVQNSINANPTGQQFGCHAESVGGQWSWQYNIFANSHNRNPLAKVNDTFINNLEYNNSAGYTTHTSTKFKHDIVNNYFIAGPASGGNFPWYQVDKNQSIYYTGNQYDSDKNGALTGSLTAPYWYQGVGTVLSSPWSSWTTVIPTMTPDLAYRYDVSAAGAFPRDEVDALVISQIKTLGSGATGTGTGTTGPDGGLYTSQAQTGLSNNGYGTITGLAAPADTDGDGMPDYWELATGSDPNAANPLTNTITGYTLLENYLNCLAAPHAVTQSNTPVTINLAQFTSGFASSATFSLANATNGTVSLQNGTNALFTPTANFTGLGGFNFTINDAGNTLSVTVTVCITPVVPPASATQFNGAIISASLASVPVPSNLLWLGDGTANVWSTTVSNWLNDATPTAFKNGDVVTFDDAGSSSPAINITATLAPGAMLFNDDQNYTLAGTGALTGGGSFTKSGSGTVSIGTVNSGMTGTINLNNGTLALSAGTSIGSGAVTLGDGTTLSLASSSTAISIPGTITVPAGNSATITSGYIANGNYGNFISGDSTSVLTLVGSQSLSGTSSSQFNGFSGTIHIVSGSVRFSANSSGNSYGSLAPNFIIDGTLQPRNAGNTIVLGGLNGSGQLSGPQSNSGSGSTVFNVGGKNLDSTFNGNVSSNTAVAGSLVCLNKVGTGNQTLNGTNTFTGTNGVLAGTLLINGTTTPSLTTVFAGAALGGTGTINGPVTVNSGGILSPGANGIGTLNINGTLTLNSPILDFSLSGSPAGANDLINLNGTLAMSGTQMFNFILTDTTLGAGTYNLITGANNSSASGVTLASSLPTTTRQTLTLSRPPAGSNPSYIQLNVTGTAAALVWSGSNGNTWDVASTINWANAGNPDVFYNLDTVVFNDSSPGTPAVNLATVVTPAAIQVNSAQNYSFSGAGSLGGPGPLTKTGSGVLTINTINSAYTGNVILSGGTLALSSGTSLGSGAMTIRSGATFALPSNGSSAFPSGPVFVPASQTANISSGLLSSGFSGNFASGNSLSTLNLSGGVSFSGNSSTQFDGFTGTINIQPGATLRFSANSSGNTYGSPNPVFAINGTLQPRNAGNTIQLGALSGSGQLAGPQSTGGSGDTLYNIGGNNADASFSGVISSNTAVAGSNVDVNKVGNGTLTLGGNSTYTGGTTVSAGTLRVINSTGSATGSGDLEVFSGATLAGNGIIGSDTTIDNGAILSPGDPTGTLTIMNNLTLNDSSLLQFALGSSSASVVVVGDLQLTGQLSVTNAAGFGPGSYPLFTCSGSLALGNLTIVGAPAGYNYSFETNTPGVVKLTVAQPTPPQFGNITISNGQIIFSGSGGTPNGTFFVLSSTNLATPLPDWQRTLTNQFDSSGNFYVTNDPATNAQTFYRLQM